MVKVSMIVPLVNNEEPLPAIDSLLRQSLEDFEIILVGGGVSSDDLHDERIKVIAGLDGGKGAAFNRGLASAGGEYIYFLEAGDSVAADLLADNWKLAEERDADLVVFEQEHYDLPTRRDFRIHFGEYYQAVEEGLGNKLYKREFLKDKGIRFLDQDIGADALFNLSLYREINSVFFNAKDYRRRGERKEIYHPMRFESDYAAAKELEELILYWGLEKEYQFLIDKGYWLPVYKEVQRLACRDCPLSYREKRKRLQEILSEAENRQSLAALEKHSTLSSFSKWILTLLQRNKLFRALLLFKFKLS